MPLVAIFALSIVTGAGFAIGHAAVDLAFMKARELWGKRPHLRVVK